MLISAVYSKEPDQLNDESATALRRGTRTRRPPERLLETCTIRETEKRTAPAGDWCMTIRDVTEGAHALDKKVLSISIA